MNRFAVLAALIALAPVARADIILEVIPSLAPNPAGSPSFFEYSSNAVAGLSAGAVPSGLANAPGTPTYYAAIPNGGRVSTKDIIATDYPSWRGTIDPSTPFAGEFGNQLFFGAHVTATLSSRFSLNSVSYQITDTFDGSFVTGGGFAGMAYSPSRVGVVRNPGGSSVLVTSGPGSQLVDELFLAGVGVSFVSRADDFAGSTPDQDALDAQFDLPAFRIDALFRVQTPEVTLTTSAGVNVGAPAAVPAPPGLILGAVAFAALAVRRRIAAYTVSRLGWGHGGLTSPARKASTPSGGRKSPVCATRADFRDRAWEASTRSA